MRQDGEPSVEEILESIKKVIARDSRDFADTQRRQRESASHGQPPRQDQTTTPVEDTSARSAILREVEDVLDLSSMFVTDGPAAPAAAGQAEDDDGDDGAEALTNQSAADAMRQSLAALAMLAEPPASPRIVRSGETSLEGLVREMLRPMMAQWLDAHLPGIVERLVKAEIARIAGKKR